MSDIELRNPVTERIAAGEIAIGLVVRLVRSPEIARIARSAGFDFLYVDGQHAIFDMETVFSLMQVASACGVAPIVRVRSSADPDIPLFLDNGALGIIVPNVDTAQQALDVVRAARFAPRGERSVSSIHPHFDYQPVPVATSIGAYDKATLVICMIESGEGVANAPAIAAVDGVDGLHVGVSDLISSVALDDASALDYVSAALSSVGAAASGSGKFLGCGGASSPDILSVALGCGAQFISGPTDLGLLVASAGEASAKLRRAASPHT